MAGPGGAPLGLRCWTVNFTNGAGTLAAQAHAQQARSKATGRDIVGVDGVK